MAKDYTVCGITDVKRITSIPSTQALFPDADIIMNDVSADNLLELYVRNGREGTLEGDPEGLFDYIEARSSTKYATTGADIHYNKS